MTRPAFTPGEGGGKPAKPKPEKSQPDLPPYIYPSVPRKRQPAPPPIPNDIVTFVPPAPSNRKPSRYVPPSGSNPVYDKHKAEEHVEHVRKTRKSAPNKQSKPSNTVVPGASPAERIPDIDMFDFLPITNGEAPAATDIWQDNTPLTPGQAQHVDHLLSIETNSLAREALIKMKREGIPSETRVSEFMSEFAELGWDDLSDARALQVIGIVINSDWDELLAHADLQPVEAEKRQLYVSTIGVKVSGTLRVYTEEAFDPNVDAPVYTFTNDYTSNPLSVIQYSKLNAFRVLVEIGDLRYWINTSDEDAQFTFVALGEPGETSTQASEEVVAIDGEKPRWDKLEQFVNTDLAELKRRAVEHPEIIRENMALLEYIFGYNVEFDDPEFYIGEGKNNEKRSAIKQVFNLASSHYHITNSFGIEVMRMAEGSVNYRLGANTVIGGIQPQYRGWVPLPQSTSVGLENVYIGSEMTIGGVTHETFHEIDRRFQGRLSIPIGEEGEGGLEWYLQNKVGNLGSGGVLGFNFGMMLDEKFDFMHLNEDSRASDEEVNQEIFPDVAAAVVFGLHEEDFFSKADVYNPDNRVGFARYGSYVKSLICGIHQYFEHIARGAKEPEQFTYDEVACEQYWSEQ